MANSNSQLSRQNRDCLTSPTKRSHSLAFRDGEMCENWKNTHRLDFRGTNKLEKHFLQHKVYKLGSFFWPSIDVHAHSNISWILNFSSFTSTNKFKFLSFLTSYSLSLSVNVYIKFLDYVHALNFIFVLFLFFFYFFFFLPSSDIPCISFYIVQQKFLLVCQLCECISRCFKISGLYSLLKESKC